MKTFYKILFMVFVFGSFCFHAFSQNPLVKKWDYRFGGNKYDIFASFQKTVDGGFLLGGLSNSDSIGDKTQPTRGNYDYWVVKIDSDGNKQWDKRFGGSKEDRLYSLIQANDGGYLLGGTSLSGITGDKTQNNWDTINPDTRDYWIVKIDSLGNKQWDKTYGGNDEDYLYSLSQTNDHGYILGGFSQSGISGNKSADTWGKDDYWIIKIDSAGNIQWDRDIGGSDGDFLTSLQQTFDNGFILAGQSSSPISGDKTEDTCNELDYWIVKTDSLGNIEWDKDFGGNKLDIPNSIDQTNDKGYIIGGVSYSDSSCKRTSESCGGFGDYDYWIVKIDSLGNKEWDKNFGGSINETAFGNISQTIDNGYLLAGTSESQISCDKSESNLGNTQTWVVKQIQLEIKYGIKPF